MGMRRERIWERLAEQSKQQSTINWVLGELKPFRDWTGWYYFLLVL